MSEKPEAVDIEAGNDAEDTWSGAAADAYAPKVEPVACSGSFSSAPPEAAFRLNPPMIGLNGGFVLFNQNCDDDRIKKLPNFKPHGA